MPVIPGRWVAHYAHDQGFVGPRLVIMVAIAAAESGLNTSAHHVTEREDSRGLWQINVRAHPWGRDMNLYDGRTNARAAARVYREARNSFTPWSVYLHDTYKLHLDSAYGWVREAGISAAVPVTTTPPPDHFGWDWSRHVKLSASRFERGLNDLRRHGRNMTRYLID